MKVTRQLTVVPEHDVTDLPDEALWCRTERHLWEWQRDAIVKGAEAFTRTLECSRCTAEKVKTISTRSFTVTASRIRYPKGYLIKGSGRIAVSAVYRTQYDRQRGMGSR
jgi:hypothetical protein